MVRRTATVETRVCVVQGRQDVSVARRMGTARGSAPATHIARTKVPWRTDVAGRGGEKRTRTVEDHVAHLGGSEGGVQRRQIETAHMGGRVEGWRVGGVPSPIPIDMESSAAGTPRETSATALSQKDVALRSFPPSLAASISIVVFIVLIFGGRLAGGNLGPRAPSPDEGSRGIPVGSTLDPLPPGLVIVVVVVIIGTNSAALFAGSALLNA